MSGFHAVQNRAFGALAYPLTEDSIFLELSAGATFDPALKNRVWSVGDELIRALHYDGVNERWVVKRGEYDTTPVPHAAGVVVAEFVLAETVNEIHWVLQEILSALVSTNDGVPIVGTHEALEVKPLVAPGLGVRVAKGIALGTVDGERKVVWSKGETLGGMSAPVSSPRVDLIQIRPGAGVEVIEGSEGGSTPAVSGDGAIELAEIHWRVGATSVLATDDSANAFIVDAREGL